MTIQLAPAALAAALAAAGLGSAPALADRGMDQIGTLTFTYDLDRGRLAEPGGASRVYRDLKRAARGACLRHAQSVLSVATQPGRACVAQVVDGVVSEAGSSALLAQHRGDPLYARARRDDADRAEIAMR